MKGFHCCKTHSSPNDNRFLDSFLAFFFAEALSLLSFTFAFPPLDLAFFSPSFAFDESEVSSLRFGVARAPRLTLACDEDGVVTFLESEDVVGFDESSDVEVLVSGGDNGGRPFTTSQ